MIVNNIPSSTVVQMAAFQFGDQLVWVDDCHRPVQKFGAEIAPP